MRSGSPSSRSTCGRPRHGALARVIKVFGEARAHHAYLFANRRANRMKVLVHDGFGLWLCARRPASRRLHLGGCTVRGCGDADRRAVAGTGGWTALAATGRGRHPACLEPDIFSQWIPFGCLLWDTARHALGRSNLPPWTQNRCVRWPRSYLPKWSRSAATTR
ncbi:MAG: IS66 family insertion sequence element accessory protein TnpB [Pseudomonadales bacterium]